MKHRITKATKPNNGTIANSVLYDLCNKYPMHNSIPEIVAKIWLIGRSYAAALERRKNKTEINDDFYEKAAGKIMASKIDEWIKSSKESDDMNVHLETHKNLVELFEELTELEKRSLASKYLHFHLPDKFFIYDSRVTGSIAELKNKLGLKKTKGENILKKYDENYAKFHLNCKNIQTEIKKQFKIHCDPRSIDNLLIEIANEKLRKKLPV